MSKKFAIGDVVKVIGNCELLDGFDHPIHHCYKLGTICKVTRISENNLYGQVVFVRDKYDFWSHDEQRGQYIQSMYLEKADEELFLKY